MYHKSKVFDRFFLIFIPKASYQNSCPCTRIFAEYHALNYISSFVSSVIFVHIILYCLELCI